MQNPLSWSITSGNLSETGKNRSGALECRYKRSSFILLSCNPFRPRSCIERRHKRNSESVFIAAFRFTFLFLLLIFRFFLSFFEFLLSFCFSSYFFTFFISSFFFYAPSSFTSPPLFFLSIFHSFHFILPLFLHPYLSAYSSFVCTFYPTRVRVTLRLAVYRQSVRLGANPSMPTTRVLFWNESLRS
jgi:hypothetical protein